MLDRRRFALATVALFGLAACEDEPETASDKIRDAGEKAGDALEDAAGKLGDALDDLKKE